MAQTLGLVTLVVRDYDEALAFYVGRLGFERVQDQFQPAQHKRWVVVSPPGARETKLLLAQASNDAQRARIGNQTGGRVGLFLYTSDLAQDVRRYRDAGVVFVREPTQQPYGTVAVFQDLYGNLWDLIQPAVAPVVSMLHHLSLGTHDVARAAAFYDAALAPLGYGRVWSDLRPGEAGQAVGYGFAGGGDKLALKQVDGGAPLQAAGFHVALAAPSRQAVVDFHRAALAAGGRDNGAPGLRPHYGADYFAAFVICPDGHHLEAVFKGAA